MMGPGKPWGAHESPRGYWHHPVSALAAALVPPGQTARLAAVVGLWHEDLGDPFQASELLCAHPLRHLPCLEHTGFTACRWGSWSLVFPAHGYIGRFNLYCYRLSLT